jgi:hypothetical protein
MQEGGAESSVKAEVIVFLGHSKDFPAWRFCRRGEMLPSHILAMPWGAETFAGYGSNATQTSMLKNDTVSQAAWGHQDWEQRVILSETAAARETAKESKKHSVAEEASKPLLQHPAHAELVWEGKYDAVGRRAAPLRVTLPFQTVETVNESAQDRQSHLQFGPRFREDEWRTRLIWDDKKYVLPSLLPEFAGRVNLIYIDPPFDTGADFSFTATVPDDPETPRDESFTFTKEPSIIEHKAYRDTWGCGLDS